MAQKLILLGFLTFLFTVGCKEHHHYNPPRLPTGTCDLYYTYEPNVAPGAIQPVVTCDVRNAPAYSTADCYMEFRVLGGTLVTDRSAVTTDFYGNSVTYVSNGNCYYYESVQLYAVCSINGVVVNTLSPGYRQCGY